MHTHGGETLVNEVARNDVTSLQRFQLSAIATYPLGRFPGLLILRTEGRLYFANAANAAEGMQAPLAHAQPRARYLTSITTR